MNSLAFARTAADMTFRDTEGWVIQTVRDFTRRYGGEYEEWLSEAYVLFMEAYKQHDQHRSRFTVWVRNYIWNHLFNLWQKGVGRNNRLPRVYEDLDKIAAREETFYVSEWLEELTDDAREAASVVLEDIPDFRLALQGRLAPHYMKLALREVLKDFGWTASRICESFLEIREALR